MSSPLESREFGALGGRVRISVADPAAKRVLPGAEAIIKHLHRDLSRFDPHSELSLLNADPRTEVEISPLMARFLTDVIGAARISGGLVDATVIDAVERAGYLESTDFGRRAIPAGAVPSPHLPRHPARPNGLAAWAEVEVDRERGLVRRPAGIRFDSGGLGKGLAADLVAEAVGGVAYFSVDCGGDLRTGGSAAGDFTVEVASPLQDADAVTDLTCPPGFAVATSGISRRAWLADGGEYRHHLIDPGTGLPAFTGVVQATAVAPTAVEAEVRAKAALLVGPGNAPEWLEFGGVLVLDGGEVIEVPAEIPSGKTGSV